MSTIYELIISIEEKNKNKYLISIYPISFVFRNKNRQYSIINNFLKLNESLYKIENILN